MAIDRKLKSYVLKEENIESKVTVNPKSDDNNSLVGLNIVSNGDSSNHLSDLTKTPGDLSAA